MQLKVSQSLCTQPLRCKVQAPSLGHPGSSMLCGAAKRWSEVHHCTQITMQVYHDHEKLQGSQCPREVSNCAWASSHNAVHSQNTTASQCRPSQSFYMTQDYWSTQLQGIEVIMLVYTMHACDALEGAMATGTVPTCIIRLGSVQHITVLIFGSHCCFMTAYLHHMALQGVVHKPLKTLSQALTEFPSCHATTDALQHHIGAMCTLQTADSIPS